MKKFLKISFLFSVFFLTLFTIVYSINLNKYNEVFRLHVRANSNLEQDIYIKEIVAKDINNYIENLTNKYKDINETYNVIINNSEDIIKLCDEILKKNNIQYNSNLYIGNIYFDETKTNDYISYDTGFYNCLIITLGEGKGNNFWNLILPKKEDIDNLNNLKNIFPFVHRLYPKDEINIYNDITNNNDNNLFSNFFNFLE